jgi:hypothetical protein
MRAVTVTPGAAGGSRIEDLPDAVVVDSVNANRRHYRAAADAPATAGIGWLGRLFTRRLPLDRFADALTARPDDIEAVLTLSHQDR